MSSRSAEPRAADPLGLMLGDLRIAGVSYGRCEMTVPWGIDLPAQPETRFHLVASGSALLKLPDGTWREIAAGDVVLLPRGHRHGLASAPDAVLRPLPAIPLQPIGERTYRMVEGGDGCGTLLFCCSVRFDGIHPLIDLMPEAIVIGGATGLDPQLRQLLEIMAQEVLEPRVGTVTVLTRLADVVIAQLVRLWWERRGDAPTGWVGAVRDPRVARAIAAMHRDPSRPWSIEALAAAAGTSPSVFRARFGRLVGMPPARYLARWRMHLATTLLRGGASSIGRVAADLGYESEAAFSRAFKRVTGTSPGAARRSPTP